MKTLASLVFAVLLCVAAPARLLAQAKPDYYHQHKQAQKYQRAMLKRSRKAERAQRKQMERGRKEAAHHN